MAIKFAKAKAADISLMLEEYDYPRELLVEAQQQLQDSHAALTELPKRIAQLRREIAAIDTSNQEEIADKTESLELIESSLHETPANITQFKNDIAALNEMLNRADSIAATAPNKLLTMTIEAQASKSFLTEYKKNLQMLLGNSRISWQKSFLTKLIAKVDAALNFKTMNEHSDVTLVISPKELKFLPSSLIRDSLLAAHRADILKRVTPIHASTSHSKRSSFTPNYARAVTNNASITHIIKTRLDSLQNSLSRRDQALWIEILSKNPRDTLAEQLSNIDAGSRLGRLIALNAIYEIVLVQNKQAPNRAISIQEVANQISNSLVNNHDVQHKFQSSLSKHTSGHSPLSKIRGSQFNQMMNKINHLQKRNKLPRETFHGFDVKPTSRHHRQKNR